MAGEESRPRTVHDLPGIVAVSIVLMLLGPVTFMHSFSRFGPIQWRQLTIGFAGTFLWIAIAARILIWVGVL